MKDADCSGKKRFYGFIVARNAAKRLKRTRGRRCHAYACKYCGGFHVGTHDFVHGQKTGKPKAGGEIRE